MASNATIAAAITAAQTMGITLDPLGMVSLLDVAIASALVDSANGGSTGPYVVNVASDGTNLNFATLNDMMNARATYWRMHLNAQGPQITVAEFSPFGQGTNAASM